MANVGTLTASLQLQSAAFIRDMGKAQQAVKSNTAKMAKSMRQVDAATRNLSRQFAVLKTGAGALAGAFAVRQFASFAKESLNTADAIQKASDSISLGTDALQEYRVASQLSGVSAEGFDKAVQRFTRSIGDARAGTGTLVTMLGKTDKGFLAQLTSAQSTEKALDLYLKKIAQTSNASDRAALAAAGFGREGVKLTNLLKDGTNGLQDMRDRARDLGLVLERDLLDRAAAVNDRMGLLKGVFSTSFDRSVIDNFSSSFQLTESNIVAAQMAGENFGTLVGDSVQAAAKAAAFAAENMREISAVIAGLAALKAGRMFLTMATAVGTYVSSVRAATVATGALSVALRANPIGLAATAIGVAVAALVEFRDATLSVGSTTVKVGSILNAVWTTAEEYVSNIAGSFVRLGNAIGNIATGNFSGALEEWKNQGTAISQSYDKIAESWRNITTEMTASNVGTQVSQEMVALAQSSDQASTAISEQVAFTQQQASALQSLQSTLLPAVQAQKEYAENTQLLDAALSAGNINFMQYNLMLEQMTMNLDEAVNGTKALEEAQKRASEAQAAAATANDRLREETQAVMNGSKAWEQYKKSRDVSDQVSGLAKGLKDAGVGTDQIKRLTEERKFLLESQSEAMEQMQREKAVYQELENIGSRAFDRIGSSVTRMMLEGKSSGIEFKDVMLGVVSEIGQSFIQLAAVNPLKNALFGSSAPTLSSAGGLFGGSGIMPGEWGGGGGILSSIGSSIGSIFGFADGGSFTVGSGMPSINAGRDNRLVQFAARDGERVTVETPGQQRMSAGESAAMSGGGGRTINIYPDLRGASAETVNALHQMVRQLDANLESRAISGVVKARQRNPGLLK